MINHKIKNINNITTKEYNGFSTDLQPQFMVLLCKANGVSSIRLLQLSNYLKVPINYFFEDFSEYLLNLEKSQQGHMNVNYNFLVKLYSELNTDQKLKFNKSLQVSNNISKVV